jgi:hypothetical protein
MIDDMYVGSGIWEDISIASLRGFSWRALSTSALLVMRFACCRILIVAVVASSSELDTPELISKGGTPSKLFVNFNVRM